MKRLSKKRHTRQQLESYAQLERRQLLAADISIDPITTAELFTVEPKIDFLEVQWGNENRLAKSGEWLIWQDDESIQTKNSIKVGYETDISPSATSHFTSTDQKLRVTDEIASGLFILSGADDWSYETVAESVAAWLPNAIVEPNFIVNVDSVPNDSDFGDLWGLNNAGQDGGLIDADIDAVEAWDISTGSSDVLVAVIDTGVDYTHPDLADNIWVNPGEIAGDGIDNDGNGYIDDIHGWDFANDDNDPMDDDGHGTHVAGTIGAVGNNNLGVTGVSQDVSIVAVKFLGANGGTTADAIRSIEYTNTLKLAGHNLVLTNNSWGGGGFESALEIVIEDALNLDILFVAAAGNSGTSSLSYPAGYDLDNIISVAATDRFDQIAGFSNFGEAWVDIAAPGVDILSTAPGGGYQVFDGTSMAAPHVAGALALLAAVEPNLSALELRDQLFERVDVLPQLDGLVGTSGRLNAFSLIDPAFESDSDIEFNADSYLTPSAIGIELTDEGGFAPGSVVVVETSSGDSETIAVTPTGGFAFSTSISSMEGTATANDGILQVLSGDSLTASYFDIDDGFGNSITITDSASIFVDDHGNDASSATPVALAFNLLGRTEASTDQDWFSFETVAGLDYEFEILRESLANATLSLYDTDGVSLLGFDDSSLAPFVSWTAPSVGTYYVAVGQADDDTGTYELSGAAIIPRGTVVFDAEIFAVPGSVGIGLTDPNGFDSGASVLIETTSGDAEVLFITATGSLAFATSINSIEGPITSNDGILQITSGDELTATYFDSDDGFGGTFTATDTALAFADDHGNDAPSATLLGTTPFDIAGELEQAGDVDWFRFEGIAGTDYEFETTLDSLSDSTLTLYDTDGTTELIFNDDGGFDLASLIQWQAPADGSYYLAVRPYSSFSQFGTYQLTGSEHIFIDDHGNDASTATVVETNFEIAGDLEILDEPDWFRFDAVAGYDYVFETTLLGLIDSTLTLYDTDGVTILSFNDDSDVGLASLIQWQAPATGSYYLEVRAFAGSSTGNYLLTGSTDQFLLGDVNQNGLVNFLDISPFISLLQTGTFLAEADVNQDGIVNFLDISPFINELIAQ